MKNSNLNNFIAKLLRFGKMISIYLKFFVLIKNCWKRKKKDSYNACKTNLKNNNKISLPKLLQTRYKTKETIPSPQYKIKITKWRTLTLLGGTFRHRVDQVDALLGNFLLIIQISSQPFLATRNLQGAKNKSFKII